MSLSFFKDFGWEAEVVCVDEKYAEMLKDDLLLQSIPANTIIHQVKAFSKKITSKFGLGSLALRSMWFYRKKAMLLLQAKNYDLIYFSTTEFPLCILGAYWKKRYNVPYVIDMQDAWHSNYYQNKPKAAQPRKYWFSYRLHKYLEPMAMKKCDGLISVSPDYINTLHQRYPQLKTKPAAVIPFGAFEKDFEIAKQYQTICPPAVQFDLKKINIVYVGRGGNDMQTAIEIIFSALKEALVKNAAFYKKLHFYFIGTSYAPKNLAKPTIFPLAQEFGLENQVTEITDRIGFYSTINTLLAADALFIPGSNDPQYTASKIYPYILTKKPLLAILHPLSPAINTTKEFGVQHVYNFEEVNYADIIQFFKRLPNTKQEQYNPATLKKYSAQQMTLNQCLLFDQVINGKN
ncbi:MAG: glycosyltransferase [Mucilaginibacter sp.]|uniref:glycosyltransferase n=1 Tax=Mucilaginibacter sp. TaxID=1882438 RepID=UPI0034E59203